MHVTERFQNPLLSLVLPESENKFESRDGHRQPDSFNHTPVFIGLCLLLAHEISLQKKLFYGKPLTFIYTRDRVSSCIWSKSVWFLWPNISKFYKAEKLFAKFETWSAKSRQRTLRTCLEGLPMLCLWFKIIETDFLLHSSSLVFYRSAINHFI